MDNLSSESLRQSGKVAKWQSGKVAKWELTISRSARVSDPAEWDVLFGVSGTLSNAIL